MGVGHVPQEPVRAEGQGADVQGRQRRGAAEQRPVALNDGRSSPTDQRNRARGRFGEDEAARWYQRHGYEILDRNWRSSAGELDLIVRAPPAASHLSAAPSIVFVEVKARRDERFGPASAAVGLSKQRTIRRLAAEWLTLSAGRWSEVRFDVVSVTGVHVEVIEAAF